MPNTSSQIPLDTIELTHTESDDTVPAKPTVRSSTSDYEIALDTPSANYSELALARALLKYNVPIQLPISYAPPHLSPPDGDMVVVGVPSQKLSSKKACLWVRFISPPSLLGEQIQLYPKKIESKKGSGQGEDFSVLTALAHSRPHAKTLFDLGVRSRTASSLTLSLMASLDAMEGGTRFSAAELKDGQTDAMCESSNPPGRDAPDPKHRGQAMRSALSSETMCSLLPEFRDLEFKDFVRIRSRVQRRCALCLCSLLFCCISFGRRIGRVRLEQVNLPGLVHVCELSRLGGSAIFPHLHHVPLNLALRAGEAPEHAAAPAARVASAQHSFHLSFHGELKESARRGTYV